jgi:hypothetical protein
LLDRHEIDVFFATGVPAIPRANHPARYTTTHLEATPGWLPVFRCVDGAVYLRQDDRNRANLERVAAYYARERVPFDARRGFDVAAVVRESPSWASAHGILPADWRELDAAARSSTPAESGPAQGRIATIYALLGLYEQAASLDRERLKQSPRALPPARRRVWSLLHLGPSDELARAASASTRSRPRRERSRPHWSKWRNSLPSLDAEAARALGRDAADVHGSPRLRRTLAAFAAPPARPASGP